MQLTSLPAPTLVPTTLSLVPSHEQLCSHCPVSSGSLGVASSEAQPRRPSLDCRICSASVHTALGLAHQCLISFQESSVAYLILMLVLNSWKVKSMTHSCPLPPPPPQQSRCSRYTG